MKYKLRILKWLLDSKYRALLHRHDGAFRAIDESSKDEWNASSIEELSKLMGLEECDEEHCWVINPEWVKSIEQENESLKDLAEIGKKWHQDSSLKLWFPFTHAELHALRNNLSACIDRLNNHITP